MHFHWNWIIFCLQLTKLRFFQTTSHMTFLLYINSHLFWHFGSTVLFNSFGEKKLTSLCWIILFLLSQTNRLLSIYFILLYTQRVDYRKWENQMDFSHFCKNNTETLQHLFFQCLKIKPIIEELNTMIIALCDQTFVLNQKKVC
jgi:hypothetical protein